MRLRMAIAALLILCGSGTTAEVDEAAILSAKPPRMLSAFGFFDDMATMKANPALASYTVTSPLFTDHAEKARWVYAPAAAAYQTERVLDFPVGSALIKTFHYGDRKVETRVLLHQEAGWTAYPYVWNEDGSDAALKIAGKDLALDTPHGKINYRVPNFNQCKACHVDANKAFVPIGPKIRNLNTGDQLARLVAHGVLGETRQDAPVTPDFRDRTVSLDRRARAYLDTNCGHCHAPGLPADTSGLYLNWEEDRAVHLGIGKSPVAAGRGSGGLEVDIAPGDPDGSILLYRMTSDDPGIMMPELGRSVIDTEGVDLIRAWIAAME